MRLSPSRVPKFASLSDFMLARRWYYRALFMPGPERSDLKLRMRRHEQLQPENSFLQLRFKPPHKLHKLDISSTSAYVRLG